MFDLHAAVEAFADEKREKDRETATCKPITGGCRRCGIDPCNGLNDGKDPDGWWVAYSPSNGHSATAEGPWEDWVALAKAILEEDTKRKAQP